MIPLVGFARRLRGCLVSLAIVLVALVACVSLTYLARERVLAWVGRQLVYEDPLEQADAAVVLGGGGFERELEAADLYLDGYAPLVVLTRTPEFGALGELQRRGVRVESSIDMRLRHLRELGVPSSAVTVLSETVVSTDQEAALIAQWAQSRALQSLTIVTARFHTGRSRFIFEHKFRETEITIRIRPSRFKRFDPESWWLARPTLRDGLFEFEKLIFYRLRYW